MLRSTTFRPSMRTLFLGLLLVLGTRFVMKTAARMPAGRKEEMARTLGGLAGVFSPRLARLVRAARVIGEFAVPPRRESWSRPDHAMALAEARQVLGIAAQADAPAINAAYRELMRRHHPDQGGAPDLASRINAARDILLAAAR